MQGNFIFRSLFLLLLLLAANAGISQEDIRVNGSVKEVDSNQKMENVEVQILQDGKTFDSYKTSGSAKFEFNLPLGSIYEIKFSKNGFVSKKIQINTKYIPEEDQEGGFKLDLDMSLFAYVEGFNESILEEPIGIAQYDAERNAIEFDFDYTNKIMNKIEAEFIRLENMASADAEKRKKYDELMVSGKNNMSDEKYDKAVANYKGALDLYPDEVEAQEKLAEAEKLLELQNKGAELEANYQKLIKDGNSLMKSKDYETAIETFNEALSLKPKEQEPKDKIRELEKLMSEAGDKAKFDEFVEAGDNAMSKQDYQDAVDNYKSARDILPDDKDVKKKLAEAQEKLNSELATADEAAAAEKRYNDLIDKANGSFDSGDYSLSINQYTSALEIKPGESYPTGQIEKARKKLEEKEKGKELEAANSAQDELNAKYDGLIEKGNDKFTSEDLEDAKTFYEQALELKPSEKYPRQRIKRIEDLLAEKEQKLEDDMADDEMAEKEKDRLAELQREKEKMAALAEEEKRKLEEELAEKERLAEEHRRKKQASDDKRRNLANNIDTNAEIRAEEFYKQQKRDDDEERELSVQQQKENHKTWLDDKQEEANSRISSSSSEVNQVKSNMSKIYSEGENYQKDKRESFDSGARDLERTRQDLESDAIDRRSSEIFQISEFKKRQKDEAGEKNRKSIEENAISTAQARKELDKARTSYRETGEVLRKDNQYQIERYKEELTEMEQDGEEERQQSQKENDAIKAAHHKFTKENSQLQRERMSDNYEKVSEAKIENEELKKNGDKLRRGSQDEIEFTKDKHQNLLKSREARAEVKRKTAREDAFSADRGLKKDYDDYIAISGTEDLAEGVTERSFEINQGKKLVIERTVKIGNRVDTYLKVIDKNATYYFKNNRSITKGTWNRETLSLAD